MDVGLCGTELKKIRLDPLDRKFLNALFASTNNNASSSRNKKHSEPVIRSDAELVADIRRGSDDASREIVERYKRLLYSIAYGFLGDHSEADDVVQQVFVRFFENVERMRKADALKTYLARSATNESIDRLRRAKRRKTISLEDMGDEEAISLEDGRTPDEHRRRAELREEINWALSQLSERQKRVAVLSFVDELSYEEIARVLDCEEVTVRTHLHRARKRLQELLAPRLRDMEAGFAKEE